MMAPSGDKKNKIRSNDPPDKGIGNALRQYAPYLTLGFQLAAAVVVFFLIGVWIDDAYGMSPLFKLIGLFVGTVGGFIKFFRSISQLDKENKKRQ